MTKQAKTRKHWTVLAVICLMYAGTQGLGANTLGVYYTPVVKDLNILHGHFAMKVTISAFATGFFSLILCLPALFLPFTFKPKEEGLLPYGAAAKEVRQVEEEESSSFTTKNILNVSFISLIGVAFFQTAIVGLNQHFPSYGYAQGMTLERTGILLSAVMVGNMTFKLLTGFLSNRLGSIKTMWIVIVLNSLSLLGLLYWTSAFGLVFNSWLYGSLFGTAVLYVVLPQELYGKKMGNYIYSYMIFFASTAVALANVGIGYLYDFTRTYRSAFWIGIGFQLLSALLLWVAIRSRPAQRRQKEST